MFGKHGAAFVVVLVLVLVLVLENRRKPEDEDEDDDEHEEFGPLFKHALSDATETHPMGGASRIRR